MLFCWGVPIVLTVLPFSTLSYGDTGGWCWIKGTTTAGSLWRFFQFYIWMWVAVIYNFYVFMNIDKKLKEFAASAEGGSAASGGMARRLRLYPMVLVICHSVGFISAIYEIFGPKANPFFVVNVIQIIFSSSLGLANAVVYGFTPEIKDRICGGNKGQNI